MQLERNSSGSKKPVGVIIPLYTYPGSSWKRVIDAKQSNPAVPIVAIINPSNGPGSVPDQNYVDGVQELKDAGVVVLGYVYTNYAARDKVYVESEITNYKDWYEVDGVLLDEMSNVLGKENYYSSLNEYAKSHGIAFTVGNPGTSIPHSYLGTIDCIVIYENMGLPGLNSNSVPSLSDISFAMVSYGVPILETTWVSKISKYVSFVYVTDANPPNPYDRLPGYFARLVSSLNARNISIE